MYTFTRFNTYYSLLILSLFLIAFQDFKAQSLNTVTLTFRDTDYNISSYNYEGTVYLSINDIVNSTGLKFRIDYSNNSLEIESDTYSLSFIKNSAFAILKQQDDHSTKSLQLPTSVHFVQGSFFAPQIQLLSLLKKFFDINIVDLNPGRMLIIEESKTRLNHLLEISCDNSETDEYINVKTLNKINAGLTKISDKVYRLKIKSSESLIDSLSKLQCNKYVDSLSILKNKNDLDVLFSLISNDITAEILGKESNNEVLIHFYRREESDWYERESDNFKVVYRPSQTHIVNHILNSAENALSALNDILKYKPKDKIVIGLYDASDYGLGFTTTIPQNFMRLEVEPLEPGYEAVTYSERYQWLISHELVHIVVNDQSTGFESFLRFLFGKVPPEKTQPTSIIYSYLTNSIRYTPRWFQEAIAVYVETWLNGGYGRALSSFDEMYFRTEFMNDNAFPSPAYLETVKSHNSFLLETVFYLYGTRFLSYLSIKYGHQKILDWYNISGSSIIYGYLHRFEEIFNVSFDKAWEDFGEYEKEFQKNNIEILKSSKITEASRLSEKTFGWVSQPILDNKTNSVIFAYHRSHELATLQSFNLSSLKSGEITSLPTPSFFQVTSLAFDEETGLLFYTTNNNQLYRDVWVLNLDSHDKKMLFENIRIGDLAISPSNKDLWGVQHEAAELTLLYSAYPYNDITPVVTLDPGTEIFQLSFNPSGDKIAAILRQSNGQQSVVILNVSELKNSNSLGYEIISSSGTPENPSWSKNGQFIYWSAFTNGVSNIYKYDLTGRTITALTNCLTGYFKPIELSSNKIFAFEFSTDGFIPVLIENTPAERLPAISYLGQKVIDSDPVLRTWNLPNPAIKSKPFTYAKEQGYNGLSNLKVQAFYPVVSGFQNQVVFGFFTQISDPMLHNDFTMEFGFSPLHERPSYPAFHIRFKYDYKQTIFLELSHHGPEFFDLFNDRKRGMLGTKITLNHNHYWLFDNPHKIKQTTAFTMYTGVEYVNDNLVRVSEPDFAVLVSSINSRDLRRSIGSSDFEKGTDLNFTITLYGTKFDKLEVAANSYLELGNFTTWLWKHNVVYAKIAGGYVKEHPDLIQAEFYFGGFGNRGIDNDEIKQFRRVFRFPGIPIYSVFSNKFVKLLLENDFPPLRISGLELANQFLNHIDFSIYTQGMIINSPFGNYWVDAGAQADFKIKHWFNLESTFSMGIAKAWSDKMHDWEWFLSIKLLKD